MCVSLCVFCPSLQRCVFMADNRVCPRASLTALSLCIRSHWSCRFKHRHKRPSSQPSVQQTIRLILRCLSCIIWKTSDQTDRFYVKISQTMKWFAILEQSFKLSKECRMGFLHLSLKDRVVKFCLYQFHRIYTASVLKTKTESLHISNECRTQLVSSFALYMEGTPFVRCWLCRFTLHTLHWLLRLYTGGNQHTHEYTDKCTCSGECIIESLTEMFHSKTDSFRSETWQMFCLSCLLLCRVNTTLAIELKF